MLFVLFQESIKPVFQAEDESAKAAARSVLLTCLDTAFKLISPFMPFLSEELWQRLPRPAAWQSKSVFLIYFFFLYNLVKIKVPIAGTLPPSICVAPYPTDEEFSSWKNQGLEEEVKLVNRIIATVRSVRASYDLPNKKKTKLIIRCRNVEVCRRI